jgi:hypothetical protein
MHIGVSIAVILATTTSHKPQSKSDFKKTGKLRSVNVQRAAIIDKKRGGIRG